LILTPREAGNLSHNTGSMGKAEAAAAARSGAWGDLHLKPTAASPSPVQSWPTDVKGDMAWEPECLSSGTPYVLALTDDDVSEVANAMHHFNSTSYSARPTGHLLTPAQVLSYTEARYHRVPFPCPRWARGCGLLPRTCIAAAVLL